MEDNYFDEEELDDDFESVQDPIGMAYMAGVEEEFQE